MKELFLDISSAFFYRFFFGGVVGSFCEGFVRRVLLGKCLIEKNQFSLSLFS